MALYSPRQSRSHFEPSRKGSWHWGACNRILSAHFFNGQRIELVQGISNTSPPLGCDGTAVETVAGSCCPYLGADTRAIQRPVVVGSDLPPESSAGREGIDRLAPESSAACRVGRIESFLQEHHDCLNHYCDTAVTSQTRTFSTLLSFSCLSSHSLPATQVQPDHGVQCRWFESVRSCRLR